MPHIYVENGKWEWYNQKKVNFSVLRNNPDSRKRDDEFSLRLAEPPGFY